MSWGFAFIFAFSIFGIMFLVCNLIESIENYKENKMLSKRYANQKYYKKDLDKCPECRHPYLWCRITKHGYWDALIPELYCVDKFDCLNAGCNFKIEVIRKWNKREWRYE